MNIPEPMHTMLETISSKCLETRTKMLNTLAAAFLESTGLKPEDCELVEQVRPTEVVFFFRKREPSIPARTGYVAPAPSPDDAIVIDGVTVVDSRKVFDGSTPLTSTVAGQWGKEATPWKDGAP